MTFPKIKLTPRRWFWILLCAAILWSFFGVRAQAGMASTAKPVLRRVQEFISTPITVLLVPPEWVFKLIQGVAVSAIDRVSLTGDSGADIPALQERVRELQDRNTRLTLQYQESLNTLNAYNHMISKNINPSEVLLANCVAAQAGIPSVTLHLDKGSMDGVHENMPVVDAHEQVTILGRIIKVGAKDSYAQLLTDPAMKVYVQIIHNGAPITDQACVLAGLGGNRMQCDTALDVRLANTPALGDPVCLVDTQWPPSTRYMVIGQVSDVRPRENQPLRYDIRVVPRIPQAQLASVMIILKD